MNFQKPIRSFRDLDVYQLSYKNSIVIATRILSKLPQNERFDLQDQLSRSSKAIPRLIAEGFAKNTRNLVFKSILTMPWQSAMKPL